MVPKWSEIDILQVFAVKSVGRSVQSNQLVKSQPSRLVSESIKLLCNLDHLVFPRFGTNYTLMVYVLIFIALSSRNLVTWYYRYDVINWSIFETFHTIQIAFQPDQNQLHTLIRSKVILVFSLFSLFTDLVTGDLERKMEYWK